MSEWTDADVERAAWVLNAVDWPDGMGDDAYSREQARALLASGVVVPARVVEEAEREWDALAAGMRALANEVGSCESGYAWIYARLSDLIGEGR